MPHLNVEQQGRLMNIVSLEGRLNELENLKSDLKYTPDANKFDIRIYRIKQQLLGLTSNQHPNHLLKDMLIKSR